MKHLHYRDYGVKGMKKGVRHEEPSLSPAATGAAVGAALTVPDSVRIYKMVNKEMPKRLISRRISPYSQEGRILSNVVKGGAASAGVVRAGKGAAVGALLGLGAGALAKRIKNRKNKVGDSIKTHKDSIRKLAIAKRRYIDALRAYRDAEEQAKISKFRMIAEKIISKLEKIKQSNPDAMKLLKIVLKIYAVLKVADIGKELGVYAVLKRYAEYGEKTAQELLSNQQSPLNPMRSALRMFFRGLLAFAANKISNKL